MVRLIGVKIHFGHFWVHLDDTNANNIAEFEIITCQRIYFFLSDDTKEKHLGILEEGCYRIENMNVREWKS